ncbi:Protein CHLORORESPIRATORY REDUCTION 42, chloroplastic [Trifolium repens]|nr:Protein CHLORORESPIRATORY REDUCTION 42, chloroplastic [Trifolium repens]
MSMSLSYAITKPFLKFNSSSLKYQQQRPNISLALVRCESISKDSSSDENELQEKRSKLDKGSPIIIIEAPKMIKTAASVPCLRVNSGLVKPGDVGRIVSNKPKDVWAVRLSIGTYLIDGKYFKPLDIAE